eukprot:SAG31_NODE_19377_length_604_cov_0.918812_1_plen_128_part_01
MVCQVAITIVVDTCCPALTDLHWMAAAVVMTNGALEWDKPATHTGMIDRSPCGTGTCAVMAVLHAKGELGIGEEFVHESIVGTTFTGKLVATTTVGKDRIEAVIPTITGSAWITQHCQVVVHPTDPFP